MNNQPATNFQQYLSGLNIPARIFTPSSYR